MYREGGDRKLTRENIMGEGRKGRNVDEATDVYREEGDRKLTRENIMGKEGKEEM